MRSKFKWIFTLLVALSMQFSFAQEKTVTGVVSDNSGPLPGANVVVKGTTKGTQTDVDGKFTIKSKVGDVLVVSFIGMSDKSVTVGSSNSYKVTLAVAGKELETVIVGSMGIKKKKDAQTSANQVVGAKELTQAANPNVVQSLTGKVSGLQINTISNGITPTVRIVLRGTRSLTGNSEALVVIDNAISTAAILAQLSPEIVESVNVVKGQQGAALYGEQGSNGVIIVTTKKGSKNSKLNVSVNSSIDFETISFMPTRQTRYGQGWATDDGFDDGTGNPGHHVPFENGGWGPAFDDPLYAGTLQPTGLPQANGQFIMAPWVGDQNNIKKFFRTGTVLQNGFSLNAGGEDGYVLFNYNRQNTEYVVAGDNLIRNSFVLKAGKKMGNFSIDANVNYTAQNATQTESDLYSDLLQTASNIPIDQYSGGDNVHHWTVYFRSPYWKREHLRYNDASDIFTGSTNLGYKINKNIDVSYLGNVQLTNTASDYHNDGFTNTNYQYNFPAPYTYGGASQMTYADLGGNAVTSSYYLSNIYRRNIFSTILVNFDYKLTDKIGAKFNVGSNLEDRFFKITTVGGTGIDKAGIYNPENLLVLNGVLNNTTESATPSQFISPNNSSKLDNRWTRTRRVSAFVNADFSYLDYLYLNATARYEKTSVVKTSQFYPSIGVSFIPTKAFSALKENSILTYAKLNTSYVITGNTTAVSAYQTYDAPGTQGTGYSFGNLNSYVYNVSQINPDIKPEFVTTKEFGFSLGFLKGSRVTLEGSFFQSDTKDLITRKTTSSASGISSMLDNVGNLQNKGFEIDLGLNPVKTDNFRWDIKGSYTTYRTKVVSLANGVDEVNLQSNSFVGIFATVGEDFPSIKGTAYQRDPQGNVIVGSNGLPLTTSTFQKLGKSTPDYILGFTNSFEYKGFKLTTVLDYRTGNKLYSETMRQLAWSGHLEDSANFDRNVGYLFPGSVQNTGTAAAPVYTANTTMVNGGGYAGVLNYYSNNFANTGEALVIDGTALKVRELALSYSLPVKMIEKMHLTSLRFGVNARNPFVLLAKENKGYSDPEASNTTGNAQGIANVGQYPTTKTYGFSINLTF